MDIKGDIYGCSASTPVAELKRLRARLEREKNDAIVQG